jgi:murein DD-endopeptidase MepM/ murein hydrolase activator NlpD
MLKKRSMMALVILLLPCMAYAGMITLPQTGQTKCYDGSVYGNQIACAGTGQDGEMQMGVAWPNPRFTNPDGTTPINGDVIVDQLTGLMWTKNVNLPDIYKNWFWAIDYAAGMNNGTYQNFGYTDWRLPNVNELESLINDGEPHSAAWLNSQGFNDVQSGSYWSSTTDATGAYRVGGAWNVSMPNGAFYIYPEKSFAYSSCTWPVRGGLDGTINLPKTGQTTSYYNWDDGDLEKGVGWPSPRFYDNGNDTVTDNLTGLIWTKNANPAGTYMNWQQALDYVKTVNTGGYTDWRLPNKKEMRSLIDYSQFIPPLPQGNPFTNVVSGGYYWSSTTLANDPCFAWVVDMQYGAVSVDNGYGFAKWYDCFAWPVRGGQCGGSGNSYADSFVFPNGSEATTDNFIKIKNTIKSSNNQNFGTWSRKHNAPHLGADLGGGHNLSVDKPVYAIANGTIKYAKNYGINCWKGVIIIEHPAPPGKQFLTGTGEYVDKIYSMYAHLNAGEINNWVKENDTVKKGQQIAVVAPVVDPKTDCSTGAHLHFEIRTVLDTAYPPGPGYSANLNDRNDPLEFIVNNKIVGDNEPFSVYIHAYDSTDYYSGLSLYKFEKNVTGSWNRRDAGNNPDLGWNGLIYSASTSSSNWAKWTPRIPKDGNYKISAFIPRDYHSTQKAVYEIYHSGKQDFTGEINQSAKSDSWKEFDGFYDFLAGTDGYVKLNSNTGETGKEIAADAIRFEYIKDYLIRNAEENLPLQHKASQETSGDSNTGVSKIVQYFNNVVQFFKVILNWPRNDNAMQLKVSKTSAISHNSSLPSEMLIRIYRPDGTLYSECQSSAPPIILDIPDAVLGEWKFEITPINIPYENFPYAVVVGEFNDTDKDGLADSEDNCPYTPNGPTLGTCTASSDKAGTTCTSDADCVIGCSTSGTCGMNQEDTDGDGVGDVCDNCPNDTNKADAGACGCGIPDTDSDSDGVPDCIDNCPAVCNPQQLDANGNGIGDVCDPDPGCGGCTGIQCEQPC